MFKLDYNCSKSSINFVNNKAIVKLDHSCSESTIETGTTLMDAGLESLLLILNRYLSAALTIILLLIENINNKIENLNFVR